MKFIYEVQKEFSKNLFNPDNMTQDEKIALSKEYILCAHRELSEALNVLPWKSHRKYDDKDFDKYEYVEELVDVMKYLLNLLIIYKIPIQDFEQIFMNKSKIVQERYEAEKEHINHL